MVCELSSTTRATLVSLPTLGCWRVTARTRRLLVTLIASVQHGSEDYPSQPAARQAVGHGAIRRQSPAGEDTAYVTVPGSWNRLRLVAGMVRHNRPHRLLPALSSCVAAAAATGAFGIFYTSIWSMADALHPGRLALISVVVIAALSSWLILHNGLWTTTGSTVRNTFAGRQAAWDNAATVITVGLSVALMYAILYLVLLISAVAVIYTGYLHSQLGHPVGPTDYARLSWLAASLGTMAGPWGRISTATMPSAKPPTAAEHTNDASWPKPRTVDPPHPVPTHEPRIYRHRVALIRRLLATPGCAGRGWPGVCPCRRRPVPHR